MGRWLRAKNAYFDGAVKEDKEWNVHNHGEAVQRLDSLC